MQIKALMIKLKNAGKKLRHPIWYGVCFLMLVASLLCFFMYRSQAKLLDSQQEYLRWKGDSVQNYAQLSFFIPVDEGIGIQDVYAFRMDMIGKLKEASLDPEGTEQLWNDAWCTTGKADIAGEHGSGHVSVLAVGGDFFGFHPLGVLSGSLIQENDLSRDRVVLDHETAWMLFGSSDVAGLTVTVNGTNFSVAGVIEREDDKASLKAYTDGMGIYMLYDTWLDLNTDENGISEVGITEYEIVLANPVKHFALSAAQEKFPVKDSIIVENSSRYDGDHMQYMLSNMASRGLQTVGAVYPYWENAARITEFYAALYYLAAIVLLVPAAGTILVRLIQMAIKGKKTLSEEKIPELKENLEEEIRVRQRRAWEKRQERRGYK